MRESCEVKAEVVKNLLVARRYRYVATTDGGERLASPPFWSGAGSVYPGRSEKARLADFLHAQAMRGWEPWGNDQATTKGRRWYAHRLYRDTP